MSHTKRLKRKQIKKILKRIKIISLKKQKNQKIPIKSESFKEENNVYQKGAIS